MSSGRRKLLRKPAIVNVGCSCRRPKLSNIFSPKPKSKLSYYQPKSQIHHSSSGSWERSALSPDDDADNDGSSSTTTTTTTFMSSPQCSYPPNSVSSVHGGFQRIGESVAVVKDSDDPYLDFQHSILQMIVEKEIYAKEDLQELLDCFLSLNSPYHHQIIIRAFTEIWNGVFSSSTSKTPVVVRRRSRDSRGFARVNGT